MANIPSGYPSAETTGVPAGTKLSVYTGPMTITQDGTVIDGKIINGTLTIAAANVVIKNSQVNYTGWWGINGDQAKNLTVQDSDIIGPGYSGDSNAGIYGTGNFLRNDISKSENGIVLSSGASTVKGNYIHDLQDGSADPHYDGIAVQGWQNGVLIEGNTIIARNTSSIFIKNDFGPISNVTVKGNFLSGDPGYQIYVDARASGGAITGVQILNNQVQKGEFGYYVIEKSSVVESGNAELKAGQLPAAIAPSAPAEPSAPAAPAAPSAPVAPVAPVDTAPSTPPKISVPSVPSSSEGGSSSGGFGIPTNVQKTTVPSSNVSTSGNHSAAAGGTSSGDVVKVGSQAFVPHSSAPTGHSNGFAPIEISSNSIFKNVSHSAFDFSGFSSGKAGLDRVSDQFSSSIAQFAKAALIHAYASSLSDGFDSGGGWSGYGVNGEGPSPQKLALSHDGFHIL